MTAFFPFFSSWIEVKDGDDVCRWLFDRHYSRYRYADGRSPRLFVGPGEKLVLTTPCRRALFVWRRFISDNDQSGVNCAVFRNEGAGLSSELIQDADAIAYRRWPGLRHYTYVKASAIRSTNPGYCFLRAGWKKAGITKRRRLVILDKECPAGPA